MFCYNDPGSGAPRPHTPENWTVHTREGSRMPDLTTIPIRKATRDRLKRVGRKHETYDDLILRLVDLQEQIDRGARVIVPFEEVRD